MNKNVETVAIITASSMGVGLAMGLAATTLYLVASGMSGLMGTFIESGSIGSFGIAAGKLLLGGPVGAACVALIAFAGKGLAIAFSKLETEKEED